MKYNIIFILIFLISTKVQSQNDTSFQTKKTSFFKKTEFKIGYNGNLIWNNGFNLGTEYVWKEKKKKTVTYQFLFNGSLGLSTNFTTQTESGLHTYYGLIWRRTNAKRWQWNIELNPLGYYRSLLPETFEVNGNDVSKVKFPGRSYYAPSLAIGIGRFRKEKKLSGWYLNFNCAIRTPYNAATLPMLSLQYGYRFNFKKRK